ncbi:MULTISPECIES: transposase [Streptomyces]|uniref:transposase n=1 Tax=Streptomyces TaxID=1883 RepID=UPI0013311908|nr:MULTISPECIES: transposase [Streptomyces]
MADVEGLVINAVGIALHARQPAVTCPSCDVTASRVHSTCTRRPADRPLGGLRVLLRLRVRRGRAGDRLAGHLPVRTSRDMIPGELRRLPDPPSAHVTVMGIDEFAFRRGATYGNVLIDVEPRRPVDLLPDRTAGAVAAWLADHPGIKVICRDRCSTFSQAASRAAPDAIQVADRRHLLH